MTAPFLTTKLTEKMVRDQLATVMDPELHVDIVSLGLIYKVDVEEVVVPTEPDQKYQVFIIMTLTTPGCPLAGMFDQMVKDALQGLPDLDPRRDVAIELTFDPPWVPDMMTEEVKAELGFDD